MNRRKTILICDGEVSEIHAMNHVQARAWAAANSCKGERWSVSRSGESLIVTINSEVMPYQAGNGAYRSKSPLAGFTRCDGGTEV